MVLFLLICIVFTLFFIALFSGIEIAFISVNRLSIELKKKQGSRAGTILSSHLENPSRFLGVSLLAVNIFLVIYGLLFSELMMLSFWNPLRLENEYLKLAFDTLLSSLLVLVFGEFIPKAIFKARNDSLLIFFTPFAQFFYSLLSSISALFVNIAEVILKYLFNVRVSEKGEAFGRIDLEHFYQQAKDQDEHTQELNTELFENALSLPEVKIRQCLVPRTEVEGVELTDEILSVRQKFLDTKLSKLLVYNENIDNIVGYIHQLDFFKQPTDIKTVLLPIPVVPETMSATDLMNKFSRERKSIAWVVDEFGGTAGIVTMEDLLEEIFGEIHDEYDTQEFVEKQIAENEFIFSGRLELDYLNEKYELEFPETDSETLSGYIINAHETIPRAKERIITGKFEFEIINVSDTRIEMVKLKVLR
jgi:CBS domain containing-hemolysin-like protein